jgi:tryptophan synthase alpha chain
MSVITSAFTHSRASGYRALIPYFMAGYPTESAFCRVIAESFAAGADIIEVGIPFSDPVADGPAIQRAGQTALEQGVTIDRALGLLSSLRLQRHQPIVVMSYLNPLLQYGLGRFVASAVGAGVRGLIVPDMVVEESKDVGSACKVGGIDLIHLLAPTSSAKRQEAILRKSSGFVYVVSVLGVTGARTSLPETLYDRVAAIKAQSRLPVAIGFGVSSPAAAARASQVADGVIVGSALVERLNPQVSENDQVQSVIELIKQLRQATRILPVRVEK